MSQGAIPVKGAMPLAETHEHIDGLVLTPDQAHPLSADELKAIVTHEIHDAEGTEGSAISQQRQQATKNYYGKPFGNEVEGRSKVVLTTVADTIDWILPDLMRMFTGGAITARYKPRNAEDVEFAEQATEYANMVFREKLDGYALLWTAFFDGLLHKNGVIKLYWEERFEPTVEHYEGLSELEVAKILDSGDWEPIAHEERKGVEGEPGLEVLHDLTVRRITPVGMIKADNVPPEEHLIAERAIKQDDRCPFSAHRKKMTVSDLVALGIPQDIAENLPTDDRAEYNTERVERRTEGGSSPINTDDRRDPASRTVWVTECYIRVDEDGDGYAELRKVLVAGESTAEILDDVEIRHQPLVVFTPHPLPHRFHGRSIDDVVADLQKIMSIILRNQLDNLYATNDARWEVVQGMVEIDDLLTSRPGGIIRVTAPGMINKLQTEQFSPNAQGIMSFLESTRQMRTGAGIQNQGLDAGVFRNQTATGVAQYMAAANGKKECIARNYANGLKDLFKKLLELMIEHPVKDEMIKLRGKWIPIDPSQWSSDMEVEVEVGLGIGAAGERIGNFMQMLQVDQGLAANGLGMLISPQNAYRKLIEFTRAMDLPAPEQFYTDPGNKPAPEPQPDPTDMKQIEAKVMETERRARDDGAGHQLEAQKLQIEMSEAENLAQFRYAELKQNRELEKERIAAQKEVGMAQVESNEKIALINLKAQKEAKNDQQGAVAQ